ncbi:MAG: HPr family phosphocarrier protein [Legionellales bacterium]|nr:HPr family phosphocarrier protein [Legionellales bacterium]
MLSKKITITNKLGLHARASAKFVNTAAKYKSKINIESDNRSVNGKSIMGILMLAAKQGTELNIQIEGPDEHEMLNALESLISNKFGEKD